MAAGASGGKPLVQYEKILASALDGGRCPLLVRPNPICRKFAMRLHYGRMTWMGMLMAGIVVGSGLGLIGSATRASAAAAKPTDDLSRRFFEQRAPTGKGRPCCWNKGRMMFWTRLVRPTIVLRYLTSQRCSRASRAGCGRASVDPGRPA
jgi:hypothetical protein